MSRHIRSVILIVMPIAWATCALVANAQTASDDLARLPTLKTYTIERLTSSDPNGANDDGQWKNQIKAGETRTIGDVKGPGVITHMWFTIATPEHYHLKKIVLRMYWDDDPLPGGIAFENFEVRERYVPDQVFIFGLTPKTPQEIMQEK